VRRTGAVRPPALRGAGRALGMRSRPSMNTARGKAGEAGTGG
jgi:hypothetical protein